MHELQTRASPGVPGPVAWLISLHQGRPCCAVWRIGNLRLPVSSRQWTVRAHSLRTWPAAGLPYTLLCSGSQWPHPSACPSGCSPGWVFLLCSSGEAPPAQRKAPKNQDGTQGAADALLSECGQELTSSFRWLN